MSKTGQNLEKLHQLVEQLPTPEDRNTARTLLYELADRCGETIPKPIPMRLPCEACGKLHIDVGEFATKPHHTHTCQHCGLTWRPAKEHTVGVQWIPGFKNAEAPEPLPASQWLTEPEFVRADLGRRRNEYTITAELGPVTSGSGQRSAFRAIHVGSTWIHVTSAGEYTVTHVDNDNRFHCMVGKTEWVGSEAEFRAQFIWVRNP
jgi:predicted RNA-binding Zn-ribbon protein involved in translation (DUF1610 family)